MYIHGAKTQNNKKQLYTTSQQSAKVDPHAKEGAHTIGGLWFVYQSRSERCTKVSDGCQI